MLVVALAPILGVSQGAVAPTRLLGSLAISSVGIGTLNWPLDKVVDADAEVALRAAQALGVNLVDTAEAYGFGRSEQLVADCVKQLNDLFPSSKALRPKWSNVVKLAQSLYREKPGMDKYRPSQATPVPNFFLAGSYTYQDYIDSMEGATKSGLMVADEVIARANSIASMAESAKSAEPAGVA